MTSKNLPALDWDITFSYHDPLLNGNKGDFRGHLKNNQKAILSVNTDIEAINIFLNEYKTKPQTLRVYKKECERLLLWAILVKNKPMSSLDKLDYDEYIEFLANPPENWCGPKKPKKTKEWRPFVGPIAASGINTATASLKSLLNWLVNAGYLSGSPLALIRVRAKNSGSPSLYNKVERFLDDDMYAALMSSIDSMPKETRQQTIRYERLRFMMSAFILLAGRISEISSMEMGHFKNNIGGWFWNVNGKGDKKATVAMPAPMVDALLRWRTFLELPPIPKLNEKIPALPSFDDDYKPIFKVGPKAAKGLGARRINTILKSFFKKAAMELVDGGQYDKAEKIKMASAHWLRHTAITQKINAGMDRHLVMIDARHSDPRTTAMYTHEDETKRSEESQKHKMHWRK